MTTFRLLIVGLLALTVGSSCSTLKSWFTPQGQKLAMAQELLALNHPLGASALAMEALVLEPTYEEAKSLLIKTFASGQEEFQTELARWTHASSEDRWDRLVELYRWQQTLATLGSKIPRIEDPSGLVIDMTVASVAEELQQAAHQAACVHFAEAQKLLAAVPGPRQARLALAEGKVADTYDPQLAGLSVWLDQTQKAATQKLLVIPFFYEGTPRLSPVSGPLGSMISRQLLDGGQLPPLTTVFPSDRLVTLPGAGPARLGLISQPDALQLAGAAGQNLVLMGQFVRAEHQEPRKSLRTETRERKILEVDSANPQGRERVLKAVVTRTTWTAAVELAVSFVVVEVATGRDLITAVREAKIEDSVVVTTWKGDHLALSTEDLDDLEVKERQLSVESLRDKALAVLARQVADSVCEVLR